MLKNESLNLRGTSDVHINQTVLQPSIKLLQIQGPLYKRLRFRTTSSTTSSQGKIRAQPWEALEIIWRCLCPQHASAHHSIPGKLAVSPLLSQSSPQLPAWKKRRAQSTVQGDPCQNSTHHQLYRRQRQLPRVSASKERGRRTGASHRQPYISQPL